MNTEKPITSNEMLEILEANESNVASSREYVLVDPAGDFEDGQDAKSKSQVWKEDREKFRLLRDLLNDHLGKCIVFFMVVTVFHHLIIVWALVNQRSDLIKFFYY